MNPSSLLSVIDVVDTAVADHFIRLVGAMKLLGARGIVTGIQPAVACTLVDLGMDLAAISTNGRLAPRAFALGVLVVYAAGVAAQFLLSGEIIARAGIWLFIVAQAALIWAWLVLHIRRLRDAGQPPASAFGIALIYALSLVLLLMLIAFLTNPDVVGPSTGSSTVSIRESRTLAIAAAVAGSLR